MVQEHYYQKQVNQSFLLHTAHEKAPDFLIIDLWKRRTGTTLISQHCIAIVRAFAFSVFIASASLHYFFAIYCHE